MNSQHCYNKLICSLGRNIPKRLEAYQLSDIPPGMYRCNYVFFFSMVFVYSTIMYHVLSGEHQSSIGPQSSQSDKYAQLVSDHDRCSYLSHTTCMTNERYTYAGIILSLVDDCMQETVFPWNYSVFVHAHVI